MQVPGKARKQLLDEINITPLTDVFLVLLIIMMVVAPMLKVTQGGIQPPRVEGGDPITSQKLVVEITRDGAYFVDGNLTPEAGLADAFLKKAPDYREKDLIIRADGMTKESAEIKVFDAAQEAGYKTMTVAVEPLTPARQDELKKKGPEPLPAS